MKKSELLKRLQHNTAQRDRLNEEIESIEKQLGVFEEKGNVQKQEKPKQNNLKKEIKPKVKKEVKPKAPKVEPKLVKDSEEKEDKK